MFPDSGEVAATAADLVVSTEPADDAGALTADAYEWQAAMAAADGLALYLKALGADGQLEAGDASRILCEYHEDWVIMQASDAELVSCKHKEPSYGAYTTVYQLVNDGGLAHLFIRWNEMEERPTCRLVTTPGLSRGEAQDLDSTIVYLRTQRLAGALLLPVGDHAVSITRFAKALLRNPTGLPPLWQAGGGHGHSFNDEQRAQACRFLSMLTIQHGSPSRAYTGYAAPSMYCSPILERFNLPGFPAEALWEAAIALFRVRMRAAGPRPAGALPPVLAYRLGTSLPSPAEMERGLASRIVTLDDLDVAIRTALAHPRGYLPLDPLPHTSRVSIKMAAGRCSVNSIERARQLRLDYRRYWRVRTSGDPTATAARAKLSRALLRLSDQATGSAISGTAPGSVWGLLLWEELQDRLQDIPAAERPADMDTELLLGGICELANLCRVWFSESFDVDAELALVRTRLGVTS